MPAVAVAGDVVATASTATTLSGAPGSWLAGPVTESTYAKLTSGGAAVVWQAMCSFTFTNSNTGATTVVPVTLSASGTALQGGQTSVLVDGDSATQQGNRLEVQASPPNRLTVGG